MKKKSLSLPVLLMFCVLLFSASTLKAQIEVRQLGMSRFDGNSELLLSLDARYFAEDQIALGVHFPIFFLITLVLSDILFKASIISTMTKSNLMWVFQREFTE